MALTTTGRTNGGTAAEVAGPGTKAWNNEANVLVFDVDSAMTYAYSNATVQNDITEYIQVTNFGFTIPATATVKGIKAYVHYANQSYLQQIEAIYLVKGGTIQTSSVGASAGTSAGYQAWGSSTSTWGVDLEYSDVNASTFGVAVSLKDIYSGTIYNVATPPEPDRCLKIAHIQLEVYYLEAEADSTISGRITFDGQPEYRLWVGTTTIDGVQKENTELVLDIQETINGGKPVWSIDTGKEALYATSIMVSGEGILNYWSPANTVVSYVDAYDIAADNGTDIDVTWESADFPLGDEKDEFILKDVYIKYNPSSIAGDVECTLSARIDMGPWVEQQTFNFATGVAGMAMIRTKVVSGTRGRTLGLKLETTTDQKIHIYEILVIYDKNVTDIKHTADA